MVETLPFNVAISAFPPKQSALTVNGAGAPETEHPSHGHLVWRLGRANASPATSHLDRLRTEFRRVGLKFILIMISPIDSIWYDFFAHVELHVYRN